MNCPHQPPCPTAEHSDREAARIVATHPEQGWNLLCNGVITFDDTGELLPDGRTIAPHRAPSTRTLASAAAATTHVGTPAAINTKTTHVARIRPTHRLAHANG